MKEVLYKKKYEQKIGEKRIEKASEYYRRCAKLYSALDS